MGWVGGDPPHCSCHFNSQFQMINGRWVNSTWGSSSLLMLLQLSTPDDQWEVGGCPPHCSCHFNSQLLMTKGVGWGSSSSLLMSLQLSTPDDQWGGWGPPHCSCHFNSPTPDDQWGGWVGILLIAHVTSTLNSR